MKVLFESIRKDMRVFFADKKAVMISVMVPLGIAWFMATLFGSAASDASKPKRKIDVAFANPSGDAMGEKLFAELQQSAMVRPVRVSEAEGRSAVQKGDQAMLVVVPAKFGSEAVAAMRSGGNKAKIELLTDPTKNLEAQVASGVVLGSAMHLAAKEAFGDVPATDPNGAIAIEQTASKSNASASKDATVAHAFLGMGVQGILFWGIEAAMGLLRERKQGIWKRIRSAPTPISTMLLARVLSVAVRAIVILAVLYGFGAVACGLRVNGSWLGLIAIWVTSGIMVGGLGLFVSALGKTEQQSRGLSTLVVLGMTMLSGAWFPSFMMPEWVQNAAKAVPAKWAVDGMDMMTWRGLGAIDVLPHCLVLLGFGAAFFLLSLRRFQSSATE